MNKKKALTTSKLVTLGLLTALVLIFSMTPLGTLPLGPLSITLNMIPVAIAAIAVGPVGGLIIGSVFGMYSFLQSMGIGIPSGLGILTFSISPFLTFVQRFVSRALTGYLLGLIYNVTRKKINMIVGFFVTGFSAAILNFVFFMGFLGCFFGTNAEVLGKIGKDSFMVYVVATFCSNTIFEIIVTTAIVGVVALGLRRARLLAVEK